MTTPPDAQARAHAVDQRRSVIVRAPAGSGKTSLLVERYLRLLAHAGRPEEILAITFTRKAAGEMRERIIAALGRGDEVAQGALRRADEQGWKLTEQPHRLKIQTIDSFASSLLRQLPLLSEFDPQVRLLEHADDLYAAAAAGLFQRLYGDDPLAPYIADFLAWLDNDHQKATRLLVGMLAKRDQWLDVVREIVAGHQQAPDNVQTLLDDGIRHLQQMIIDTVRQAFAGELFAELDELTNTAASNLGRELGDSFARYRLAGELFVTQRGEPRKTLTKNQGFPRDDPDAKARALTFLERVRSSGHGAQLAHLKFVPRVQADTPAVDRLISVCVSLTLTVIELGELFTRRGVCDFTQLTLGARTALGADDAPTELALALDYRIKHILVDEFQDTSVAQFQLFEQLVAGWQPGDGNSLFVVGDPMQSVYRFRDAEVSLFFQAWHQGIGAVALEPVQLTANFRANADLVAWSNRTFAEVFGDTEDPLLGQVAFAHATATRERPPHPAVAFWPCASDGEQIAHVIATLTALLRQNPQSRIAILVRSRPHLQALLPALRGAGLVWRATDLEPLTERPVVMDLLALARTLASPWDRLSWFAVLRSPWVGLTLVDLEVFADTEDFVAALAAPPTGLSDDGRHRLARLREAWHAGFRLTDAAPPRRVLETVWLTAGGADAYGHETDLDAAERLLELIDQLGLLELDPRQLEISARALYANDTTDARLEILTIHKAKGLEFDHVLLPFLNRQPRRSEAPLLLWRPQGKGLLLGLKDLDRVYQWLAREDRAREEHELKRLFYVASTRARESLHLFGQRDDDQPAPNGSLQSLLPEADATGDSGALTDAQVHGHEPPATFEPGAGRQADLFAQRGMRRLKRQYLWHPPASLAGPQRAPSPSPTPDSRTPGRARVEGAWQVALGTLVHEVLRDLAGAQRLPAADDYLQATRAHWQHRATEILLDTNQTQRLVTEVDRHVRKVFADATGRWILGTHRHAGCEVPLTGIDADTGLTNVFLDRMFVDERGQRWIIDYKTASSTEQPVAELIAGEVLQHRAQLARYARFVRAIYPEPLRIALYFTAIPQLHELTDLSFPSEADLG